MAKTTSKPEEPTVVDTTKAEQLLVNIQSYLGMVGADNYQKKYFSLKFKDLEEKKTLKEWELETGLVFKS